MSSAIYDEDIPEINEEPVTEFRSATAHASQTFASVNHLRNKLSSSADERSKLLPSERIVDNDSTDAMAGGGGVGGSDNTMNSSNRIGNMYVAPYPRSAMFHLMVVCLGMR